LSLREKRDYLSARFAAHCVAAAGGGQRTAVPAGPRPLSDTRPRGGDAGGHRQTAAKAWGPARRSPG